MENEVHCVLDVWYFRVSYTKSSSFGVPSNPLNFWGFFFSFFFFLSVEGFFFFFFLFSFDFFFLVCFMFCFAWLFWYIFVGFFFFFSSRQKVYRQDIIYELVSVRYMYNIRFPRNTTNFVVLGAICTLVNRYANVYVSCKCLFVIHQLFWNNV